MIEKHLKAFFRLRGVLMAPPVIFVLLAHWYECESEAVNLILSIILFVPGVLLRFWAQIHLHYRLKTHKVLTLTGPYVYVRNPIYVGNMLILLGLCAMSELIWFCPIMLIWSAAVNSLVVRYEETHLKSKYGDAYLNYLRTVPRWFPRLRLTFSPTRAENMRSFIIPSIWAELHSFVFIIPFIVKEVISRY